VLLQPSKSSNYSSTKTVCRFDGRKRTLMETLISSQSLPMVASFLGHCLRFFSFIFSQWLQHMKRLKTYAATYLS